MYHIIYLCLTYSISFWSRRSWYASLSWHPLKSWTTWLSPSTLWTWVTLKCVKYTRSYRSKKLSIKQCFSSSNDTLGPSGPGAPGLPLGPSSPLGPVSPLSPGGPLSPYKQPIDENIKLFIAALNNKACLIKIRISRLNSINGPTLGPIPPTSPTSPARPCKKRL